MLGLDLGVVVLLGQPLRRENRFLGFFGVLVEIHKRYSLSVRSGCRALASRELCERLVVRALLWSQLARQLGFHRCIQVAKLIGLTDKRHPFASQTKHLPVLGPGRYAQTNGFSAGGRDFGLAAENRGRYRNAHFRVQVLTLALESRVRRHVDTQVQIPRTGAVDALLTLT